MIVLCGWWINCVALNALLMSTLHYSAGPEREENKYSESGTGVCSSCFFLSGKWIFYGCLS